MRHGAHRTSACEERRDIDIQARADDSVLFDNHGTDRRVMDSALREPLRDACRIISASSPGLPWEQGRMTFMTDIEGPAIDSKAFRVEGHCCAIRIPALMDPDGESAAFGEP